MDHLIEKIESNGRANDEQEARAARQIQQLWRRKNATAQKYMNSDQRWQDAAIHARVKVTFLADAQAPFHPISLGRSRRSRPRKKHELGEVETRSSTCQSTAGWESSAQLGRRDWRITKKTCAKESGNTTLARVDRRVSLQCNRKTVDFEEIHRGQETSLWF